MALRGTGLTGIEHELVAYLRDHARRGDPPPTYRELCLKFGWSSTATVRDHLRALSRKGYVELSKGRARAIRLLKDSSQATSVPLVGQISAGIPVQVEQQADEAVVAPQEWLRDGEHFAVRVTGDSMRGAGVLDGDRVVARQQRQAADGDIVVATIGGETTLKRLKKRGSTWWLVPENKRYKAIPIRDQSAVIQGVMVGLLRGDLPLMSTFQRESKRRSKTGGKK